MDKVSSFKLAPINFWLTCRESPTTLGDVELVNIVGAVACQDQAVSDQCIRYDTEETGSIMLAKRGGYYIPGDRS